MHRRLSTGIAPWLTNNGSCNEKAWRCWNIFFALLDVDQVSFVCFKRYTLLKVSQSGHFFSFFIFSAQEFSLSQVNVCLPCRSTFVLLNSDQLSFVPVPRGGLFFKCWAEAMFLRCFFFSVLFLSQECVLV